jgi:hypothetical protein
MSPKAWIFCEKQLVDISFCFKKLARAFVFWTIRKKSKTYFWALQQTNNDWEAFYFACWQNFELNLSKK